MSSLLTSSNLTQADSSSVTENKFKAGDIVCERIHPNRKLIVRRYLKRIYYCKLQEDETRKDLAFFERELMPESSIIKDSIAYGK